MKILFDTSAKFITKAGVANYITELLNAFRHSNLPVDICELAYKPSFSRNSKFRVIDSLYRDVFWPSLRLSTHSKKNNIDLIHCPAFHYPLSTKQNLLVTIHDIYSLVKPSDFNYWHGNVVRKYISRAIHTGKHILVLTEFTKNEILNYFPSAKEEYIHVVHSGVPTMRKVNYDNALRKKNQTKFSIHTPYILSVSTIEPRKNFYNLIKAFSILKDRIEHQLVLVGQNGWNNKQVFELITKLNLTDRVCFTGYVDDEELNSLYSNADCFVFPSFYEGFGFTPLEAMRCECPVVSSDASCMPEILGNAAIYFDPLDIENMASAIFQMIVDSKMKEWYKGQGLLQQMKYSWSNAAEKTYKVYEAVLNNANKRTGILK